MVSVFASGAPLKYAATEIWQLHFAYSASGRGRMVSRRTVSPIQSQRRGLSLALLKCHIAPSAPPALPDLFDLTSVAGS